MSGVVRVVDVDGERRLVVGGEILSAIPLDGDWSRVRREYWGQAFAGLDVPRRPDALFVGLGGGTQVHLLRATAPPRHVTIVEHDPLILGVARRWFGLDDVDRLEVQCADALLAAAAMARAGRRFDIVVEDAAYAVRHADALALTDAAAALVGPGGVLLLNRHGRRDAQAAAARLVSLFDLVELRRVKREGENVLVRGLHRRPPGPRPASV